MEFTLTFTRRVLTARRYVIENIMDLDHVCIVHRRWFSDLRIREWRAERVDYQLTSHFFGLKQDVHVTGAPIDADRYWYRFDSPLASIRVDGRMDGPDGELVLTEAITWSFPAALAPAFFALRPLFHRQKQDILRDDTALLEREYALEQQGYRRPTPDARRARIAVFGGSGFFGRLVVQDLLDHGDALVRVASRRPRLRGFGGDSNRLQAWIADLNDAAAVDRALEGVDVAVNCAGPFQGMPHTILERCIARRVHYVDAADDRDFVERAHRLGPAIETAGIAALVGCSVVPGMSSVLTRMLRREGHRSRSVRICITPGTRFPRGPGSFECLLATVGDRIEVPRDGRRDAITGWSERERVEFPLPVGPRHVYSVVDIADYFTQPLYFGASSVHFKIGAELDALNRAMSALRPVRQLLGSNATRRLVPVFRAFIAVAAPFGTTQGAMMVTVRDAGRETSLCVMRPVNGEVIPAILPSVAASMLARNEVPERGVLPLPDWIPAERFADELALRGVGIWRREERGAWTESCTVPRAARLPVART